MLNCTLLKGEIWLIHLDPTIGAEIQKMRPAIIVNENAMGILPLRIIVPLMEWKDRYIIASWMVRIDPDADNGLDKPSAADTFQIRSVSQARFTRQVGRVSDDILQKILEAIQIVVGP